ncbi:MAG TPA: thioredoxin domain-containing protein [Polyangia bacterium]|nr:thioredoxin domain-containing protein [Polyangia bacterium]
MSRKACAMGGVLALLVTGGVIGRRLAGRGHPPGPAAAAGADRATALALGPLRRASSAGGRWRVEEPLYRVPAAGVRLWGSPLAKLTIVEFADFDCPFSRQAAHTLQAVRARYQADAQLLFVNCPVAIHPAAGLAAEAFLAADEQGKATAMHDRLMTSPPVAGRPELEEHARAIGLDLRRFRDALDSHRFQSRIESEQRLAAAFDVGSSPTCFVNGARVQGSPDPPTLGRVVEDALERADDLLQAGTRPAALYEELVRDGLGENERLAPPQLRQPANPDTVYKVDLLAAPVRGPASAAVTIVMWCDYQHETCRVMNQLLRQLEKLYGRDLRWAWKDMPHPFHRNSELAARAGRAARDQGRFWQMHDLLFESPNPLTQTEIERYAGALGLDRARISDPGFYRAGIQADIDQAHRLGAQKVPTIFINGRFVPESESIPTLDWLRGRVDQELARTRAHSGKLRPRESLYEALTRAGAVSTPMIEGPLTLVAP